MSDPIEELKQRVKWLEKRIDELEKDHGTVAVYLKSTEPQLRNAILELVEYLANAPGVLLPAEEQKKLKKILGQDALAVRVRA